MFYITFVLFPDAHLYAYRIANAIHLYCCKYMNFVACYHNERERARMQVNEHGNRFQYTYIFLNIAKCLNAQPKKSSNKIIINGLMVAAATR